MTPERKALLERLHKLEADIHKVWSAHCAGAACKAEHKPIWNEIQAVIRSAIYDKLEKC